MKQKCYAIIEVTSEETLLTWPARIIAAQEVTYATPGEDWPVLTLLCDPNEETEEWMHLRDERDGAPVAVPRSMCERVLAEGILVHALHRVPRLDRYMAPYSASHCDELQHMGLVMSTGFRISPAVEINFSDTGDDSADTWRLGVAVSPEIASELDTLLP